MSEYFQKLWGVANKVLPKERLPRILWGVLFFLAIIFLWRFDANLVIGLFFVSILTIAVFWILFANGIKSKALYILFLTVLLLHIGTSTVFHYTKFQPFSGG